MVFFFISSFTNAEETAQGRGIFLSVIQEDVSFIPPKYDAFENIRLKPLQNKWENRKHAGLKTKKYSYTLNHPSIFYFSHGSQILYSL